jgi:hypothetical protein
MTSTPTLPPTDRSMWRKLLAKAHPDAGGSHELFIWTANVRDMVCGEAEPVPDTSRRREGSTRSQGGDRVPFETRLSFDALTRHALGLELEEPFASLIELLADCYSSQDTTLYKQQYRGATYKQLAAIGHAIGLSKPERVRWYRIAESIPLSQRHAGHILGKLQRAAA